MAKKETTKREIIGRSGAPPDNELRGRKELLTAKRLETVIAILLGMGFMDRASARRNTVHQFYRKQ